MYNLHLQSSSSALWVSLTWNIVWHRNDPLAELVPSQAGCAATLLGILVPKWVSWCPYRRDI